MVGEHSRQAERWCCGLGVGIYRGGKSEREGGKAGKGPPGVLLRALRGLALGWGDAACEGGRVRVSVSRCVPSDGGDGPVSVHPRPGLVRVLL